MKVIRINWYVQFFLNSNIPRSLCLGYFKMKSDLYLPTYLPCTGILVPLKIDDGNPVFWLNRSKVFCTSFEFLSNSFKALFRSENGSQFLPPKNLWVELFDIIVFCFNTCRHFGVKRDPFERNMRKLDAIVKTRDN